MRKSKRILLGLILLSSSWVVGGTSLSAQQSPQVKTSTAKETGQCTLTFQYLEGPGLLLAQKPGPHEQCSVISAKERTAWLAKVQGKPDVWMMKEPVNQFHSFGATLRDFFGVEDGKQLPCRLLCNYQVTTQGKGAKVDLDLGVNVWTGEAHVDFRAAAHQELAEGDTLVLQSPHPKSNMDRVLLVTARNRPLPPERVVRLELLDVDGGDLPSPGFAWSCFNAECQNGVPEKEVHSWFQKSGTTLEARTAKKTRKELKNTESWSIVDGRYETPTLIYSEVIESFVAFYLTQKIHRIQFTEEDRVTKHGVKIHLEPDPANESAAFPFILKSDFTHQRGARSGHGSSAKNTPKPGNYLVIDTTKPQDRTWSMLLIRAAQD